MPDDRTSPAISMIYAAEPMIFCAIKTGQMPVIAFSNPAIAVCLGFIYDQKASTLYNQEKSIEYYAIAANGDDAYAQYALGGILLEKGEPARAIDWYARCSAAGDANCSYMAYRLHKNQKNNQEASIFLERALVRDIQSQSRNTQFITY